MSISIGKIWNSCHPLCHPLPFEELWWFARRDHAVTFTYATCYCTVISCTGNCLIVPLTPIPPSLTPQSRRYICIIIHFLTLWFVLLSTFIIFSQDNLLFLNTTLYWLGLNKRKKQNNGVLDISQVIVISQGKQKFLWILYSSPNIITVIKLRMKWAGSVTREQATFGTKT